MDDEIQQVTTVLSSLLRHHFAARILPLSFFCRAQRALNIAGSAGTSLCGCHHTANSIQCYLRDIIVRCVCGSVILVQFRMLCFISPLSHAAIKKTVDQIHVTFGNPFTSVCVFDCGRFAPLASTAIALLHFSLCVFCGEHWAADCTADRAPHQQPPSTSGTCMYCWWKYGNISAHVCNRGAACTIVRGPFKALSFTPRARQPPMWARRTLAKSLQSCCEPSKNSSR